MLKGFDIYTINYNAHTFCSPFNYKLVQVFLMCFRMSYVIYFVHDSVLLIIHGIYLSRFFWCRECFIKMQRTNFTSFLTIYVHSSLCMVARQSFKVTVCYASVISVLLITVNFYLKLFPLLVTLPEKLTFHLSVRRTTGLEELQNFQKRIYYAKAAQKWELFGCIKLFFRI